MKKVLVVFSVMIAVFSYSVRAQISAPGMGEANTASWLGLGIRQALDAPKKWESMTYAGIGRKSDEQTNNPFLKPAIFVLNEEVYHNFHPHLQYSFALSYRRQNEYQYLQQTETSSIQQELRTYGRFTYFIKTIRTKWSATFRQELRRFYNTNFKNAKNDIQLRTRFRLQGSFYLGSKKIHKLSASSEQFFAAKHNNAKNNWSKYQYTESRFSLYYSYEPPTSPFIFSIGYMNDWVSGSAPYDAHYAAVSVVWEDPFNNKKNPVLHIDEDNLE